MTHSNGVRMANSFHVMSREKSPYQGVSTAAQVRDELHGKLTTKFKAVIPATITVDALVVREELAPSDNSVPDEAAQTIGAVGTLGVSGDLLPVPTCALLTIYTNAAVRSGHGRMFLPACYTASTLNNVGNFDTGAAPFATTLPTLITALLAGFEPNVNGVVTNAASLGVYSRTRRAASLSEWFFDATNIVVRTAPHWLRSRTTAP
jgi:hypothetical protein